MHPTSPPQPSTTQPSTMHTPEPRTCHRPCRPHYLMLQEPLRCGRPLNKVAFHGARLLTPTPQKLPHQPACKPAWTCRVGPLPSSKSHAGGASSDNLDAWGHFFVLLAPVLPPAGLCVSAGSEAQALMNAASAQTSSHSRHGFWAKRPAVRLSRTTDTMVLRMSAHMARGTQTGHRAHTTCCCWARNTRARQHTHSADKTHAAAHT